MSQGELPAYQGRSKEARRKIVSALDEALREKPFDKVSVAEIAEKAGVAVGTVYQRFKNKQSLLPVVMEVYQTRVEEWAAGGGQITLLKDDDLRVALRKIFRQTWKIFTREAHLLRAVHLHVRLKSALGVAADWKAHEDAAAAGIAAVIDHFKSEVRRKNKSRVRNFTAYFLNAIMIEKALYPDESPATFFTNKGYAFADECADMLYAYLTLPEAK